MQAHLRANLWLLLWTVILCNVAYPVALLVIGRTAFSEKAEGSLIYDRDGRAVGSRLIAQPFSGDRYFQPRPSAVSYNAAASGASNWGGSNYLLRERVARQLGPIVTYRSGDKSGQRVGPDIETWFQQDQFQGQPGIVAQWATAHPVVAANWVKVGDLNKSYVRQWLADHPELVAQWKRDNRDSADPQPEELAVPFFVSFSQAHPGKFVSAVASQADDGNPVQQIEPVSQGSDIQGIFFDMWRQEHPAAELAPVPADMVMASGSGLDPHITLQNALYQLERVATARTPPGRDPAKLRQEISDLLRQHARAPLGGLAGVELVHVLELNLLLDQRFPGGATDPQP